VLRISLSGHDYLDAFCAFLREVNVETLHVDGAVVRAAVPGAVSDLHERRELAGYVTTWNALNPMRPAELLD
jgi:hypothetical protein